MDDVTVLYGISKRQNVDLNHVHGTCVLEQDKYLLLFTQEWKWVPVRVIDGCRVCATAPPREVRKIRIDIAEKDYRNGIGPMTRGHR